MLFGIPTLILVLFVLAAIAGVATIPIVAYLLGGMLPAIIAEPLANLLLVLSFLGMDSPTLHQTETGEYEFVQAPTDAEPTEYWTRFAWSEFAITASMAQEAFNTLVVDVRDVDTEPLDNDAEIAEVASLSRGGKRWFMRLGQNGLFALPIGQLLSKFQNAAGMNLAVDAAAQGEKEHGGDTAAYSPKMRLMGHAFFAVMGAVMGYLFFLG